MNEYQVTIGSTYYNQNYFNVGVAASHNLGNHNETLNIILPNSNVIKTVINRTANNNASVRFNGRIEWHQFVINNYNLNDVMRFQVNNPNTITILPNDQ